MERDQRETDKGRDRRETDRGRETRERPTRGERPERDQQGERWERDGQRPVITSEVMSRVSLVGLQESLANLSSSPDPEELLHVPAVFTFIILH